MKIIITQKKSHKNTLNANKSQEKKVIFSDKKETKIKEIKCL